ncbi:MAG: SLC13 family permease [Eggerthellaceae bacterium]
MKKIAKDSETFTEAHRAAALARHAEHMAERAFVRNPLLIISAVATLITMVFVPPSLDYLGYIDWHTIICLFCIMAVLEAIDSSGFLDFLAHSIVEHVSNTRSMIFALVVVTLGCSMILSNDMTLVTVLPLVLVLLKSVHREKRIPFAFIMITLTANLGGMLLPFGNPHNLYLYSIFQVDFGQFVLTMAPPLIFSMALIFACCATVHPGEFHYRKPDEIRIPRHRVELYLVLFGVCIAITVNAIPYVAGALVIVVALALADRDVFTKTDYSLILTFICFFVMSGNVAQIPAVANFLEWLLQTLGVFPTALVSSQVISNVPSAIILSRFTDDWAARSAGHEYRRRGHAHLVHGNPYHAPPVPEKRSRLERQVRGQIRGVQLRLPRSGIRIRDVRCGHQLTQPARPIRNRQKTVLRLRKPRCTDSSPLLRKRAASRQSYKTVRAIR